MKLLISTCFNLNSSSSLSLFLTIQSLSSINFDKSATSFHFFIASINYISLLIESYSILLASDFFVVVFIIIIYILNPSKTQINLE